MSRTARFLLAFPALAFGASCGHDEREPVVPANDEPTTIEVVEAIETTELDPVAPAAAQLLLLPLASRAGGMTPFPAGSSVRWLDRALTSGLDDEARRRRLVADGQLFDIDRETKFVTLEVPVDTALDLLILANDGEVHEVVAPLVPEQVRTLTITLPERKRRLTGQLLRPDGQPIGEVSLVVNGHRETWVGPDGAFDITLTSNVARLTVEVDGWPPLEVVLDPEEGAPLELRFADGATLRARVLAADGTARPGIRVEAIGVGGRSTAPDNHATLTGIPQGTSTGPDGTATLTGIPPGREFQVRIRTAGHPSSLLLAPAEVLSLTAGEVLERDYVLPQRGPIAGRLLDQAGRGVADVEVGLAQPREEVALDATYLDAHHLVRRRTVTDESGRFRFDDVDGEYWLVGVAPGPWNARLPRAGRIAPVAQPTLPGEANLELTTARRLELVGRVVDQAGEPVVRVRVAARPQDFAGEREVLTKRDGSFTLKGLVPGPHDVWVEGELVREGLDPASLPIELRVELDRSR